MSPALRISLRLAALLWLAFVAGLLTACGGGGDPDADAPQDAASAPSTQPVDCKLNPEKCT